MAHPIEVVGSPEHQAVQAYRANLDQTFSRYGFGAGTLRDIRANNCVPFLIASWDKPSNAPRIPGSLIVVLEKVTAPDLKVSDLALTHDFAQVRMARPKMLDEWNEGSVFEFGWGDYPDTNIHPWVTLDLSGGEISASHYGITGDFPGTYDRTRQARELLAITELDELVAVVDLITSAPIREAVSRPDF